MIQERRNMSQSFYKYIVDELLVGYFSSQNLKPGSRFYIVIDNEEHRKDFINAITNSVYSSEFEVSHIYNNAELHSKSDVYFTRVLKASNESLPLIIGDSTNATDDYLTTLRNTVGCANSEYTSYGILYILSNCHLESLTTTCVNLQAEGLPLNSESIKRCLNKQINEKIVNDYEKFYLKNYLDRLSEKIGDGNYSLFDYQEILSILSEGTLRNSFKTLEYFNDEEIYSMFPLEKEVDMLDRVKTNAEFYNKVSNIFSHSDGTDRVPELSKILDDKFAEKIAKLDSVNQINFDDILHSIEKKAANSSITFEDCLIDTDQNESIHFIKRIMGSPNKKSNIYIIIADTTNIPEILVKLCFKSDINGCVSNGKVHGRFLRLNVPYGLTYTEVGKDNNIHKIFIKRVKTNISFFNDIKQDFKLYKNGNINVDVADSVEKICLGTGDHEVDIPDIEKLEWNDSYKMFIPLDSCEDCINFSLLFDGIEENFVFKFSNNRLIPKSPLKIFELVWSKEIILQDAERNSFCDKHFYKVYYEEETFLVHDAFRKYLCLEKQMIENDAVALGINKKGEFSPSFVDLPDNIKEKLHDIYDYFKRYETVPSLCYINDELAGLYSTYLMSILETLNKIPETRKMSSKELALTHLGVVEMGNKIMFSPFHPLIISYFLEFRELYDKQMLNSNIWKLLSPFYLVPYLFYNNEVMRPYTDIFTEGVKTWLTYENVNAKGQVKTYDITSKMVNAKMSSFISHFSYLFQDINSPIIISTIGISDDTYVIKGIVEFIKSQYAKGSVQHIEIHEYVNDLLAETYFEKLNRINSDELIVSELKKINVELDKKDQYTAREIIRQMFTRISFYKHDIQKCEQNICYSHIAFYMMDPVCQYATPPAGDMRTELSINGLVSIPSTINDGQIYYIGFGSKGLKLGGSIYQLVTSLNNLYANARNNGHNQFQKNICVAKTFKYDSYELLNNIYSSANWVTFLNPEVDIDFFYRQKDVYIVHYTDQYTINAKYDSITVTKHVDQYENMLSMAYNRYTNGGVNVSNFNKTMKDYFNSLNGSWLLGIINKTETQIREKLSIVGASIIMNHFLKRMPDAIWIPISMEEIYRVSGSIGLPKEESIFSAKSLGEKGSLSDDLLMMGLNVSDPHAIKLMLYPVEVKIAKTGVHTTKGEEQVAHSYHVLKDYLVNEQSFVSQIYKTFFASQFLTNADKLYANKLLSEEKYQIIMSYRFDLLNLGYVMSMDMPDVHVGHAALVYFYTNVSEEMETSFIDDVAICHLKLSHRDCFECVADPKHKLSRYLSTDEISLSQETYNRLINKQDLCEPENSSPADTPQSEANDECKNHGANESNNPGLIIRLDDYTSSEHAKRMIAEPEVIKSKPISITIGTSMASGENIVFQPNNTNQVTHPNLGIIGTMGTGKTQLARSIIAQFSKETNHNVGKKPIGLLVFDYKGDYKDDNFLTTVNGECYKYQYPFNPLKLVITDEANGLNLPAITADRISDSCAKAYGLGPVQQSSIKKLILDTYNDFGINKDPKTWDNPVPTIENVIEKYFETTTSAKDNKLFALFDKLNDYNIFTTDNSNCVSLFEWLDGVKIIDLTLYPDDTKKLIVSLILDLFYSEMKQLGDSLYDEVNGLREIRAMIMVDEAHQFIQKDFFSLRSIISEGRMFGVGMILSTQNMNDFKSKNQDYTSFILSWVIHHVNNPKTADISNIFGSTDPNLKKYESIINLAGKFESICKIGQEINKLKDLPYYLLSEKDPRFFK